MKKILLLNPPGTRTYVRDFYCSKTSKSGYQYTPVDLLCISAYLLPDEFDVSFIDCILDAVTPDVLMARIQGHDPDVIVILCGYVSWREDFDLIRRIKKALPETMIIGSGDVLQEPDNALVFRECGIDAIAHDFSSPETADFIRGKRRHFQSITYKDRGRISTAVHAKKTAILSDMPRPRHELFPLSRYAYPFVRHTRFATVLTDFACPFRCSFCIMGTLPYRYRPAQRVLEELDWLHGQGIREIYFADQTFGANKKNISILLDGMIERGHNFGWVCFSRVDVIDAPLLGRMKAAGCHTIIFGIEFGSDAKLKESHKQITTSGIRDTLALCRTHGIRTVGTFLMGEPKHTPEDLAEITAFSLSLNLDFASFNIYVPRSGGLLRRALAEGRSAGYDQSGAIVTSFAPAISDTVLADALRKAVSAFYRRPSYIMHRLFSVRSLYELKTLFTEGLALLTSGAPR